MKQMLRQIDQELVQLLGKLITALEESTSAEQAEYLPYFSLLLSQAKIPESIWQNVMSNCATVSTQPALLKNIELRRITIIGGGGKMGSFFTRLLSTANHHVNILETNDWVQAQELLAEVDLVLICVPLESTLEVICKVSRYLSPTTALADIASIKVPVLKCMLEYHKGPVMGMHPMFGPSAPSFSSQNVVICPGRENDSFKWLLELIESEGGNLVVSTPEEHDHMMTLIQAIQHFAILGLGVFLSEEKLDLHRSSNFSSPVFRQEIGLIKRLLAQSAPLIVDIMMSTQERRKAIAKLANTYSRLAKFVTSGEREHLIAEFKAACNLFFEAIGDDSQENTHNSNALKNLLTVSQK